MVEFIWRATEHEASENNKIMFFCQQWDSNNQPSAYELDALIIAILIWFDSITFTVNYY